MFTKISCISLIIFRMSTHIKLILSKSYNNIHFNINMYLPTQKHSFWRLSFKAMPKFFYSVNRQECYVLTYCPACKQLHRMFIKRSRYNQKYLSFFLEGKYPRNDVKQKHYARGNVLNTNFLFHKMNLIDHKKRSIPATE